MSFLDLFLCLLHKFTSYNTQKYNKNKDEKSVYSISMSQFLKVHFVRFMIGCIFIAIWGAVNGHIDSSFYYFNIIVCVLHWAALIVVWSARKIK